jgi:hypothetical protein
VLGPVVSYLTFLYRCYTDFARMGPSSSIFVRFVFASPAFGLLIGYAIQGMKCGRLHNLAGIFLHHQSGVV